MAEAKARSCGGGEIKRHWSRSLLDRCGAIGTVLQSTRPVRSVRCGSSDWSSVYGRRTGARSVLAHRFSLSLSLSLSLCASEAQSGNGLK